MYIYDGANKRTLTHKAGVISVEYTPSTAKLTEYTYLGTKRVAQVVTP